MKWKPTGLFIRMAYRFSKISRFAQPFIPEHLRGRLRVEQVDNLAKLGGAIGAVGVLAAVTIVVSFWSKAPRGYLTGFVTVFMVLYLLGFRRSLLWRRRPKPLEMDLRTYRIRNMHVGVIGLLWSTMPLALTPYASADQHLLIVYVSSGLIASAVVISSTLLAAFMISVPVMIGTFASMLMMGGSDAPLLAVLVVIYSLLIFISTIHSYRTFVQRTVGRMELEEQREVVGLLLREFEQSSSDWLWQTDEGARLQHVSERMTQVTGISAADLGGHDFLTWLSVHTHNSGAASHALAILTAHFRERTPFRDVLVPVKVARLQRWWSLTGKPVVDRRGAFTGYRGVASDVTSSREAQERIAHMASHDSLTGLPNRVLFQTGLDAASSVPNPRFALLWLDLDQFKAVNDTLGHSVGDALLVQVAERLRACAAPADLVARLGGDEFAILQRGAGTEAADALARCIVAEISAPYDLQDGVRVGVGVSAGITVTPADGENSKELLKRADLALYRAKADGRGTWRFYEAEMDERAQERRALQSDLRHALERGEFSLVFQPIIDLAESRVVTLETLLRWSHPERGPVSPARFIPIAEETGLIVAIGHWVLSAACEEAARWSTPTQLAVNLSPVQFRDPALLQTIRDVLRETGLAPERLELELTESIFLEASDETVANLHRLRELGVSIVLDDFGTGYSSLSYLRSFPFDKVKIDQSFIRNISNDRSCLAIVRAITGMANSLDMKVVAEGVETEEQIILLRMQGCSRVQGYYFSRPLPADQIDQYMRQDARCEVDWPKQQLG